MIDNPVEPIEDILDYFNISEMQNLIETGITSEDVLPGDREDLLQPMWVRYQSICNIADTIITDEEKAECRRRFNIICTMFIDAICAKFNLTVDAGWMESLEDSELHGFTLMLYTMFILDMRNLLVEVIINYIESHITELVDQYSDNIKLRKDATYNSFKTKMEPEFAIVAANIYSVCYSAMDVMSESDFFDYVSDDYYPKSTIQEYFIEGHIDGNFVDAIYNTFKRDQALLAHVAFDIISNFKEHYALKEDEE